MIPEVGSSDFCIASYGLCSICKTSTFESWEICAEWPRFLLMVVLEHDRDSIESAKQKGKGMAQDLLLLTTGQWGFELSEVPKFYQGPLHIFNGDQDWLVSLTLQEYIKQLVSNRITTVPYHVKICDCDNTRNSRDKDSLNLRGIRMCSDFDMCLQQPDLVHLHSLPGEGHLSAFCFNDKVHLDTLSSLFGSAGAVTEVSVDEILKRQDLAAVKSIGAPNTLSEGVQEDLQSPYIH